MYKKIPFLRSIYNWGIDWYLLWINERENNSSWEEFLRFSLVHHLEWMERNHQKNTLVLSYLLVLIVDSSVLTHGDILLNILDCLTAEEITRVGLVCKFWRKVSQDERLWKGDRRTNFPSVMNRLRTHYRYFLLWGGKKVLTATRRSCAGLFALLISLHKEIK